MKKMNVLISALVLAVSAVTPMVSSAEFAGDNDKIEVSQHHKESYTIIIPAGTENLTEGSTFDVSATAFIEYGQEFVLSVESTNNWKLVDTEHSGNTHSIPYKMKYGDNEITGKTADVLTVAYDAENHEGAVTLTAYDIASPDYAGTYSDTLTFTTSITASSNQNEVSEESE